MEIRGKIETFWNEFHEIPEKVEYDDYFDYPLKFLGLIGYNLNLISNAQNLQHRRALIAKIFMMWVNLLNPMFYVAFTAYEAYVKRHNYHEVVFAVIMANLWSVLLTKMTRYFWMKKELTELKDSLREFYPKTSLTARKYLQKFKILSLLITTTCILGSSFFALIPVIVYGVHHEIVTPLPLVSSLLDSSSAFVYPFVYIWEVIVVVQSLLILFGFDIMTITLILTISQEWSELNQEFGKFNFMQKKFLKYFFVRQSEVS
jgi:hypothetical protein